YQRRQILNVSGGNRKPGHSPKVDGFFESLFEIPEIDLGKLGHKLIETRVADHLPRPPGSRAVLTCVTATGTVAPSSSGLTFSRKRLGRRRGGTCTQQPHVLLILKQLILQLHVERLAFNVLHLRIDRSRSQLHFSFSRRRATIDLVTHLIER